MEYILGQTTNTHNASACTKETTQSIVNDHFFWTASMLALGAMCVMFPTAFMLDRIGRKLTMLSAAPLLCISFLIVGVSFNAYAWMVGRFVMGFAGAAFGIAGPIFVGEIAQHNIRGTLCFSFQLLLVIGIAMEYTLGLTGNWSVVGCVSAAFPLIFFIIFIFMPETPTFLLMKGKSHAAAKSLQWYRGKNYDIRMELKELKEAVEEMTSTEVSYKDLFRTVAGRKSLIISLGLMIFQQLSGINVVMFHSSAVFQSTGSVLTPISSAIVLAIVQIAGTLVSTSVVDRVGRKLLLYVSHVGMGVCLCAVGFWFVCLDCTSSDISAELRVIPMALFCLYLMFFSLGCGPIPFTMVGEIFPKELKGICGSIAGFVNWGSACIVTVTFSKLKDAAPPYVPFFIYALFCFICNVFCFFIVVETKGKTLEEIQKELQN